MGRQRPTRDRRDEDDAVQLLTPLLFFHDSETATAWQEEIRLASGGVDGTVRIWDVPSRRGILTLRANPLSASLGVAFSPDGRRLASAGGDGTVQVWAPATGREVLHMRGHSGAVYYAVAFSPDGRHLASGSRDQSIKIWDATRPAEPTL